MSGTEIEMRFALFILLLPWPVLASERHAFYGSWGTAKQCASEPIKQGGTVRAQPFEISAGWLKQGSHWCRLSWFPVEQRKNGLFTGAIAQCGEDAVRAYRVRMELQGEQLSIRWGFSITNGPLLRCADQ